MTLMLGLASAGPADAHATLLSADPPINGVVAASPAVITLVFDEPVTSGAAPIRLADAQDQSLALGPAATNQGGLVVTVPVTDRLADGVFSVAWQVTSDDGDGLGGAYQFAVGPATTLDVSAPAESSAQRESPGLIASSVLRWMLFASLAVALGGLVGAGLVRRQPGGPHPAPSPWTGRSALVGLLAAAGLSVLIAGSGDLPRGVTAPSVAVLTDSRPGRLALLEVAAFAVAVLLVGLHRRRWAWIPLLAVVVAEGLRAHLATALPGWGPALTGFHLLAAAIWAGALAHVLRTALAWRSTPRQAWALVAAYGRLAAWLFAAVVATGTASALLLVPLSAWTSTAYGRTLLVKLALVAAVTTLAVLARRRLRSERHAPEPQAAPGRAAGIERVLLVAALAVSAVLVSLPPPKALSTTAELPLPPPPPVGLVVPLGARVGRIGVSAAASTGQLVVHLSDPTFGYQAQNQPDPTRYRLGGTVTLAGQKDQKLRWRDCGPGCFTAPARWANGQNHVSLSVGSKVWPGGTVALIVPWPAQAGDAQLRRVVAAMTKVRSFTLYEQVTSDNGTGPGQMRPLVSGKDFLASEPYGAGIAPQTALLRAQDGQITLAVGFPGDLTQAELVTDARGRVLRESLTAPHQWITRTFRYPLD